MIYQELPEDFLPLFEVAGCFMEYGGEFLLLRRNPDKSEGGKWGVPGGKKDANETLAQALVREINEETGVQLSASDLRYAQPISVRHPRHDFIYHIFSAPLSERPQVILNPAEHQAFMWTSPARALELELVSDVDGCIEILYGITA